MTGGNIHDWLNNECGFDFEFEYIREYVLATLLVEGHIFIHNIESNNSDTSNYKLRGEQ